MILCDVAALCLFNTFAAPVDAAQVAPGPSWVRRYQEGQTLTYSMDADNNGRRYRVVAQGSVKKNAAGTFVEEYRWSDLEVAGTPVPLAPATASFRQTLSLDQGYINAIPDLRALDSNLVGPTTDLLSFYSDLWLATRLKAVLLHSGDHVAFPYGKPASWADGVRVVFAQDAIDFEITLAELDPSADAATIVVRHVPPASPAFAFPAAWMRTPVGSAPNNWVEVRKDDDGTFDAEVGMETFDDRVRVRLRDGAIISATMENPVEAVKRVCRDAALTSCGAPAPRRIVRRIAIRAL